MGPPPSRKRPRLTSLAATIKSKQKLVNAEKAKQAVKDKRHAEKMAKAIKAKVSDIQPSYPPDTPILLLGEGNFSFARSLLEHGHIPATSGASLYATAFDSESTAVEKYSQETTSNLAFLRDHDVHILFNIDGTKLSTYKALKSMTFSRIVFNFPHTGAGIKDQDRNIRAHQLLLSGVLSSCLPFLAGPPTETHVSPFASPLAQFTPPPSSTPAPTDPSSSVYGQLHITLKGGEPYTSWNLKPLAKTHGYTTLFSSIFSPERFPGYEHRRTLGWKDGVSIGGNVEILKAGKVTTTVAGKSAGSEGARTYVFVPLKVELGEEPVKKKVPVKSAKVVKAGKRAAVDEESDGSGAEDEVGLDKYIK